MFSVAVATVLSVHSKELPIVVDGWLCNPTRLMVKAPAQSARAAAVKVNGRVIATFPQIGWATVELPPVDLHAARKAMESVSGVQKVAYDRAAQLAYDPNDPLWPNEWHMRQIKCDLAWDTSKGSDQTIVADIDTGCLVTHPDLAANINVGLSYNFVDNNTDVTDVRGHGTGTAGLIGAVQDNGIGLSGACPHLQIMVLKACNDSGYLYDSYLVPAYLYGADHGARVFSMSYFSDRVSEAEKSAMDYAVAHNVLPIAAAGNASSIIPFYPGAYENVMAVAATDENNQRCWFSNYGTWVDVSAPGQDLVTTANNGDYMGFAGTSGATPHVAGVAALLIGAKPTATSDEVRDAIEDTANSLFQPPFGEISNYGLVDAQAALNTILTVPAPPKPCVVRYVATLGQGPATSQIERTSSTTARIYGRGFQGLQDLKIIRNGKLCTILNRSRDWVDFILVFRNQGDVQVWDGSNLIATVPDPVVPRICNCLVEASAPTASVTGNFFDTVIDDGKTMVATRDSNGNIILEGTFRKVLANATMQLRVNRFFTMPGGSENIQLYDWSSASYPYGNWVDVSVLSTSTTPSMTLINVPDIARYIDFEGTVYVRIVGSNLPAGDTLEIDSMRLQDRR